MHPLLSIEHFGNAAAERTPAQQCWKMLLNLSRNTIENHLVSGQRNYVPASLHGVRVESSYKTILMIFATPQVAILCYKLYRVAKCVFS